MQNTDNLCMGCMSETTSGSICSVCGFDEAAYNEPDAISLRTLLADRYLVGKVISSHGGGYTYLGYDTVAGAVVKIREYFPAGICKRLEDGSVEMDTENSFVYNDGIMKFIELYKKLGSMGDISAFFRVVDLFETQKTAYAVSEYLPGISLKEFLLRNGGSLRWEQVRPLFLPLIGALKALHTNGVVHGGISPETLMVGRDGRIRISDFSIPEIRNAKSNMTAQLFPGFAALEQYEGGELTPATDIYSFAATVFRTLTGNPPADALSRLERDNMTFPKSVAEELPRGLLIALANALQLRPEDRTSSAEAFKADLDSSDVVISETHTKQEDEKNYAPKNNSTKKYTLIASVATAVILAVLSLVIYFIVFKDSGEKETPSSSTPSIASVVSVGDIGNSEKPESLFSVPDFTGKTYAELLDNDEYKKWFVFTVAKKEYSDTVEKGKICGQSLAVGSSAKKETKIELTVSLGPKEVTIPKKLQGMTKEEAYVALLELGFDPSNIEFIEKRDDTPTEKEVIIEASPQIGTKISPDEAITLYYNSNIIVPEDNTSSEAFDNSSQETVTSDTQITQ